MAKRTRWVTPVAALFLAVFAGHSAVVAGAEYKGSRLCLVCHKKTNPDLVAHYPDTPHAKALLPAEGDNVVADFANAPFPREQAAYVLGSGRNQQAYLDKDFKVLPGRWLVADKKWVEEPVVDGRTECVGCHVTNYNPEGTKPEEMWTQTGVGCEMCHGPASKHISASAAERGNTIVKPRELTPDRQMMNCGQCHSRGRDTTGKYAFPIDYLPGEDLGTYFVDAKPQTAGQNQQYSDLRQSPKHFENGVTCEKCHEPHGNSDQPHQLRLSVNETCTQCHADNKDIAAHAAAKGATVPDGATCATCHMPEGRHLFDSTLAAH